MRAVNDSTTAIATCEPAKQFDGRTQPHTCLRNVGHYLIEGGHERFANEEGDHRIDEELSSGNVQKVAKNKANELDELLRAFHRGTSLFFAPKLTADHSTHRRHRRDLCTTPDSVFTMYPRSFTLTSSRTLNFATSCC